MATTLSSTPRPQASTPPRPPAGGSGDALVRWFAEIGRPDIAMVGGKGANLGEMTGAGLPVPPGFVITTDAYRLFYETAGIGARLAPELARLNLDDPDALQRSARALQEIVVNAEMPAEIRGTIVAAYETLSEGRDGGALVAVRSSATAEDTAQFSFAGMFESFLNVSGENGLVHAVKRCWASTFGGRVLFYRLKQGFEAEMPVAVVVQRMVQSERSGVMFTVDPARNDPARLVIEAAWGLGEAVVLGQVTPDRYVLAKDSLAVVEQVVSEKEFLLTRNPATGESMQIDLTTDPRARQRVLSDDMLRQLGELGRKVEAHYAVPQDVEFAIEDDQVLLTQTRPITTLEAPGLAPAPATVAPSAPLVRGLGASPGIATGAVRVLATPADGGRLRQGEILVARMTSPDWVPIMRRAAAIVTDAGGMTSHASIVSRELGIPCIVGTKDATRALHDGLVVTVDGKEGVVRAGTAGAVVAPAPQRAPDAAVGAGPIITATRLYVNLAEPERADAVAARNVDGVGLLRAEFMMLSALDGLHPRRMLQEGRGEEFVERMRENMVAFARAFHPRPVIYRAMDFRSNEFRGLSGGEEIEPKEDNPMIGYRGCYRYTREPDLFSLELEALHRVRAEFDNIHLMIPFVRTASEFRACKGIIDASPLAGDATLQLWVMAEVPSVVSWLEEYVRLGATGASIGSNDLTQLVLGVDRDSEVLAPLYDERDKAVLDTIHAIIAECRRLGVSCSICGQAPSVFPEYAEMLVRWGIDSISVNPDQIETARRNIAVAEQRMVVDAARMGQASTAQ